MKSFDHEFVNGYVYVWRDDIECDDATEVAIILDPVLDHYQKPDSLADNPDDYYGYIDWHFEEWDHTDGWDDNDTQDAMTYAQGLVSDREVLEHALSI